MSIRAEVLELLACPRTREPLAERMGELVNRSGTERYRISKAGIALFAEHFLGEEARRQQAHYDKVAQAYIENNSPNNSRPLPYMPMEINRGCPASQRNAASRWRSTASSGASSRR